MAKKKKKTKKIVTPKSVSEPPELSETPVIDGKQANAPVKEPILTDRPMGDGYGDKTKPEPSPPSMLVVCMGCKGRYDLDTMQTCPLCKGKPTYCPACAAAGTCHKCGKELK